MRTKLNLLWALALLFTFIQCDNSVKSTSEVEEEASAEMTKDNMLSDAEKEAGWMLLFDGENADQWKGYNKEGFPEKGWVVQDGQIKVLYSGTEEEGHGGDLITSDKFENFEFSVDFMLSDTANSGIFYRVIEEEGTPIWHNAPEYQLLDDAVYKEMGGVTDAQFTGANYDIHAPSGSFSNPVGEWNTAKIVINNNKVEHYLNGNMTVSYDIESNEWVELVNKSKFKSYEGYGRNAMGHLGLQDHGHTVSFKNIKVRKL